MEDLLWWGLNLATLGFGHLIGPALTEGSVREAFQRDVAGWEARGVPPNLAVRLVRGLQKLDLPRQQRVAERMGAVLVGHRHPHFPSRLRDIPDPPLALAVLGRVELLAQQPLLAVVGARQATEYGREVAWQFSRRLAQAGVGIVSGLACGIDARAHQGALDAAGTTIAFLGCGLDVSYPAELESLRRNIARQGAVVSQYAFGSRPLGHHFPYRNRLISGLSDAVLVVEGKMTSGSLHTVDWALQQGREVYTVPGSIFSANSALPHHLLQMGATLVTSVENLLPSGTAAPAPVADTTGLSPVELEVLQRVGQQPVSAEQVAAGPLKVSEVLAALLSLEIQGLIQRSPANRYFRDTGPSLN